MIAPGFPKFYFRVIRYQVFYLPTMFLPANVLFPATAANSSLCAPHMCRTWVIASISSGAGSQRRPASFFGINRRRMWTHVALPIVPDQRHGPLWLISILCHTDSGLTKICREACLSRPWHFELRPCSGKDCVLPCLGRF